MDHVDAAVFEQVETLDTPDNLISGLAPKAQAFAHLRIADDVTAAVARFATGLPGCGFGRAGFAPAGRLTVFLRGHPHLLSSRTSLSWSHQPPRPQDTKEDTNQEGQDLEFDPVAPAVDEIAHQVVDSAIRVHRTLGPGLLESVYEVCLCHELHGRGVSFARQVPFPIVYHGVRLDAGLRLDLIVGGLVIVEVTAVNRLSALFEAQLLTYLKLTGHRIGLLINFDVPLLKDGIRRLIL